MSLLAAANHRPLYLTAAEELRDNPGQWQVYQSRRNCVVLAGPGSGKTKTLTIKLARMLAEDVRPPRGVACITYSNECAQELRRRLKTLGVVERGNVFIGTVHSFCLQNVLLPYGRLAGLPLPSPLTIAQGSEQGECFARAVAQVISVDEPPRRWQTEFDKYRRTKLNRNAAGWRENDVVSRLIERFEALLGARGLIDFDDMMLAGYHLIKEHEWIRRALKAKFPVLVVDEYQDLGVPLHGIVAYLCFEAGVRVLAVGDPDQSIYGFVGARPEMLRKLATAQGIEAVRLPFNYRCGKKIVRASEVTLGEARGYQARGDHEGLIDWHECPGGLEEQAQRICGEIIPDALARRPGRTLGDVAVLYRAKTDGDIIARSAADFGFHIVRIDKNAPYPKTPLTRWLEACAGWCSGGWERGSPSLSGLIHTWLGFNPSASTGPRKSEMKKTLVRALMASRSGSIPVREWLSRIDNDLLKPALEREPTLRHEVEGLEKLRRAAEGVMRTVTVARFAGQTGSPDHLNLITLHSSKGLEFEVVIIMGMDQGNIPNSRTVGRSPEDRRLFYVGMTRTKHEFHMTYSGWVTRGRYINHWGPSEFLLEVQRMAHVSEQ